jgi:hypothetical protein
MSDILSETIVSIRDAAALFPGRRTKSLSFSTVWRWVLKGVRCGNGQVVRLEAVRLGSRWVTSREAIARFSAALTPRWDDDPAPPPRTPEQRRRASEKAARALADAGI